MYVWLCSSMIKGFMLLVQEIAVQAKIAKTDCFVENGIFSVSDRTQHHALSLFIYCVMKDCCIVQLQCETFMKGVNSKRYHVAEA